MRFIGVDLAWSDRNPTGIAVLEGDGHGAMLMESPRTVRGVEAVAAVVARAALDGAAFVAVDAPLRVPNLAGRRPAEADLARDFARYYAGPHPANRTRLADAHGLIAGERLAQILCARHRFEDDPRPATDARSARRLVFEAFPHPAQVALFGLDRRIAYKHGPPPERRAGLARLRGLVRGRLPAAEPPLLPEDALDRLCAEPLESLRGRALKDYEDRLDALVCAYVALYYWYWGGRRCRMYGSAADGHIITPSR